MEENIEQEVEILNRMAPDLSRIFGIQDLEEVLDIDIKFAHIPILCQIRTLKSPTMGELGEISNFQLSTLTRVVDRLVERELVAREADASDRRVVRIRITDEGSQIVRKFEMARKKKVKSILMRLTSRERKDLIRVLQDIHKRISSEQ
ncbi:MarR family transcriptional regulator [Candidatus Aerophobetes bacterium]|nr:MarR family transcriptional regulator [Candidatus Aerophobetes bacterium]